MSKITPLTLMLRFSRTLSPRPGWLMLPFALAGFWHGGMAVLFAYAAGSFFWAQREAHRGEDAGPREPLPPA